jgi:hypothetical protein
VQLKRKGRLGTRNSRNTAAESAINRAKTALENYEKTLNSLSPCTAGAPVTRRRQRSEHVLSESMARGGASRETQSLAFASFSARVTPAAPSSCAAERLAVVSGGNISVLLLLVLSSVALAPADGMIKKVEHVFAGPRRVR